MARIDAERPGPLPINTGAIGGGGGTTTGGTTTGGTTTGGTTGGTVTGGTTTGGGGGGTVTTKVSLAVSPPPSVTVNTIVVVPNRSAIGETVNVRLLEVPPITIWDTGNNVAFDDVAEIDKLDAADSASEIVKSNAPTIPCAIVISAIA